MSLPSSLDFTKLYCHLHPCELVTNYCNDCIPFPYSRKMPSRIVCHLRMFPYWYAFTNRHRSPVSKCQRYLLYPTWLTQGTSLPYRRRQVQASNSFYYLRAPSDKPSKSRKLPSEKPSDKWKKTPSPKSKKNSTSLKKKSWPKSTPKKKNTATTAASDLKPWKKTLPDKPTLF